MSSILHLDYESRSTQELGGSKSIGIWNYCYHKETEPLLLAWAYDQEPVEVWEIIRDNPMPDKLRKGFNDSKQTLGAFNSTFERYVSKRLGFDIPIERWEDAQPSARYLSLPGNLQDVSSILGLPVDLAKEKDGKRLLDMFSKPSKRKKKRGESVEYYYRNWITDPDEWLRFVEYCRQDVIAEREVMRREQLLGVWPLPLLERKIWIMDQAINDRGILVDTQFVRSALKLAEREKTEAIEAQNKLTGLENANSNSQMLEWVKTQGFEGNSLRKGAVDATLKYNLNLTPLGRQVLEARKAASSTTYKKLSAILLQICSDSRLRNLFTYMGSPRCGRWAGSKTQIHNFARPAVLNGFDFEQVKIMDEARKMVYEEDYEGIKKKYGSVLLVIKSLIRTVFIAGKN
jgi:DNA polymerase